jgi:hypothetical protein
MRASAPEGCLPPISLGISSFYVARSTLTNKPIRIYKPLALRESSCNSTSRPPPESKMKLAHQIYKQLWKYRLPAGLLALDLPCSRKEPKQPGWRRKHASRHVRRRLPYYGLRWIIDIGCLPRRIALSLRSLLEITQSQLVRRAGLPPRSKKVNMGITVPTERDS